jgi:hypothetical protein
LAERIPTFAHPFQCLGRCRVVGRRKRTSKNHEYGQIQRDEDGQWSQWKGNGGKTVGTQDAPGTSEYKAYKDETADIPALVVQVGKTILRYHLRSIDDLHAMLTKNGDWVLLGSADEQKPAAEGTVEAWGRSSTNPVKGWYGLKK